MCNFPCVSWTYSVRVHISLTQIQCVIGTNSIPSESAWVSMEHPSKWSKRPELPITCKVSKDVTRRHLFVICSISFPSWSSTLWGTPPVTTWYERNTLCAASPKSPDNKASCCALPVTSWSSSGFATAEALGRTRRLNLFLGPTSSISASDVRDSGESMALKARLCRKYENMVINKGKCENEESTLEIWNLKTEMHVSLKQLNVQENNWWHVWPSEPTILRVENKSRTKPQPSSKKYFSEVSRVWSGIPKPVADFPTYRMSGHEGRDGK